MSVSRKHIGILGVGKMGEALVRGLLHSEMKNKLHLFGSVRKKERVAKLTKDLSIEMTTDNAKVVEKSEIVILGVKPHQAENVLKEVSKKLTSKHILISICAAITLDQLHKWSGGKAKIIRVMPNLPSLIGAGMSVIAGGANTEARDIEFTESLFKSVGRTVVLEESLFDGVTALSACGPAFIFLIIESFAEAGVKVGISREASIQLAAQTMMGSAKMVLDQKKHPAALKDEVTTPAGCTVDGLMVLEDGRLRATIIRAIVASTERSASLREPK